MAGQQPEAPAVAGVTRDQLREMVSAAIEKALWDAGSPPASEAVLEVVWPLLERQPSPVPAGPSASATAPSAHKPGPLRMVARRAAPPDCLACGQRWPCEGSWQARAEAAEARLAAIRVSARDSGRVVAIHPDDGTYAAKEISFAAGSSRSLAEIIAAFEHSNHLGSEEPGDGG